jgi:amino acid transporter
MTTVQHDKALGRARLSLSGVLAQSVGFMGPVFSLAALLPLIVGQSATGRGAGVATPLAILIAGAGVFGAGWIIAQYAKRIHLCGSLYEYICDAAGTRAGIVAGWLYYGAMLILGVANFLVLGGQTQGFLQSAFTINVPWWPLSLGFVALVTAIVVIGVRFSVRAQLILVLISAAVVLGFSVYIIGRGGLGGHSLSMRPFNPGAVGRLDLLYGVLYGINMFIGFETAANLAEETDNPKRHVPRAVLLSLTIVGAYFLLTAYAQDAGFGMNASSWKNSGFPLQALASGSFGSAGFGNFMYVLIILDILAVAIGTGVAVTRGMLAMARAGRLPAPLATVHRRYQTPVTGALVLAGLSAVIIIGVWATNGFFALNGQPQWLPMFSWMAGIGGTGLAVMYFAISVTGIRGLWQHVSRPKLIVAGAAGIMVAAGAVFGAVYKAPSPLNSVPWVIGAWIVLGLLWSYYAMRREPALAAATTPVIVPGTTTSAEETR